VARDEDDFALPEAPLRFRVAIVPPGALAAAVINDQSD